MRTAAIVLLVLLIVGAMVAVFRYLQSVYSVKKAAARLAALAKDKKIETGSLLRGIELARQQSQKINTEESSELLLDIEKTIPRLSLRFKIVGVLLFTSAILLYFLD